jgi:predicted RecA/RadA family phage recombinase
MATATFKRGDVRTAKYLAGADIAVDQIVLMNAIDAKKSSIGVARQAIANGAIGIVAVSGVFAFPKVSGAVIKAGESVNWDASAGEVDDNAATAAVGDLVDFGKALTDAGNGVTVIDIDISEPGTYKGS